MLRKKKNPTKQPQVPNDKPVNNLQTQSWPNLKKDLVPEPAPYTVVQTLASKLRMNQARIETPIDLSTPKFTTKQCLHAVIFNKEDFMGKLAARYKYTLVGKVSNTMPKFELIRRSFILQTQITGGVKIAHFNATHVYIDLDNEVDYIAFWTRQR